MKKIFIAGPWRQKKYQLILEHIRKILEEIGYKTFVGAKDVDNYGKIRMSRHLFWKRIVNEIKNSDVLIVDMKNVGTGFGRVIEVGIAKAFNKKVILLYPSKFKTDECLEEVADKIISYKNLDDLQKKLKIIKIYAEVYEAIFR